MSKFLVQLDELNYPNKIARKLPAGEDASDWLELMMSTQLDSDFALHFDKYPINPDTKTYTPRVGAPTGVTNGQLLEQYNAAIAEIRKLKDDNTTKDATIDQLKTDLATANSNIGLTNQALMEFATAIMPTTDTDASESQSESTTESASGSTTDSTSTTLSESASESESTKGSDK